MIHASHNPSSWNLRSLALLAGLTLGSAGALMAQTTAPSPQGPGTPRQHRPVDSDGKAPSAKTAQHFSFQQVDTNRDGHLTPQEAQELPSVAANFKAIDKDGDGQISEKEFLSYSGEGTSTGAGNNSGIDKASSGTATPGNQGAGTQP